MKPQETAQERAEKYERSLPTNMEEGGMYFAYQVREAYIAGEESGERLTLERLAAKDAEIEKLKARIDELEYCQKTFYEATKKVGW